MADGCKQHQSASNYMLSFQHALFEHKSILFRDYTSRHSVFVDFMAEEVEKLRLYIAGFHSPANLIVPKYENDVLEIWNER